MTETPKATGAWSATHPPDAAAFTKRLCHRHRTWAVDATKREELPVGWQALTQELFNEIAAVMMGRPVGMMTVRGLKEESGGLMVDLCPVAVTAEATRVFRTVQRLVERARRAAGGRWPHPGLPPWLPSTIFTRAHRTWPR